MLELLFVRGLDSLFGGRRGVGADCSLPIMRENKKARSRNYNLPLSSSGSKSSRTRKLGEGRLKRAEVNSMMRRQELDNAIQEGELGWDQG